MLHTVLEVYTCFPVVIFFGQLRYTVHIVLFMVLHVFLSLSCKLVLILSISFSQESPLPPATSNRPLMDEPSSQVE